LERSRLHQASIRNTDLLLHRAGHAGDVMLDEKRIQNGHRQGTKQRARHQCAPVIHVAFDEFGNDPTGTVLFSEEEMKVSA